MKRLTLTVGRMAVAGAALAVALLWGAAPIRAQQTPTLGDVAKKEAARRKAQPSAGKVYTNKDLPASAQKPAGSAAPATAAPAAPVAAATQAEPAEAKPAGEAKPEGEVKDEAWWRTHMASTREEVRRNEIFAEALQTRINSLSRDFVNRDNPAQRAKIGQDRAEALAELARVKQDIERGKKQIGDLEEEARRSGVPPGWLR
jgi:hypothetical protein